MTGKRIGYVRQYACEELEELMLFTPESVGCGCRQRTPRSEGRWAARN